MLGILTASTIAYAQPATLEGRQRELALDAGSAEDRPEALRGFHAGAFAQLTGGSVDDKATSDLAAGAELSVRGDGCDYLRLGGQGRLGWKQGDGTSTRTRENIAASAEQWASVCAPLQMTLFELGHHLEWDVRPSLLAPLGMRPGNNRRETFRFHWRPVRISRGDLERASWPTPTDVPRLSPPPPGELIVFDIDNELTWLWSSDGNLSFRGVPNAIPFGYTSPQQAPWGEDRDFLAALMRGGGEFADDATSIFVWFGEIENLKLGPLFASGGIGIISAGAGEYVEEYTQEVDMTAIRAKLQLETGNENVRGYLKAANDVELAPDGYVIVDRRITSGIAFDIGRTHITLDGAFGRSRAHVPKVPTRGALVGGGSLSLIRELTKHLRASVQVEVGKSFYAIETTSQDFTPRWGARALGVLQAVARR